MANTLITLKNASLAFGDYPLLDNTDFSVQEGERIGLIGRNGTGKSSMLQVLARKSALDDGEIQVKDGLRHLVVTGAIQPGDQLPSVRALASSLAINPNTIQRAYESLEAEGYLYTMPGKGSYASEQTGVNQDRRRRLLEQFDAAASELIFLGMTAEELALRVSGAKEGRV